MNWHIEDFLQALDEIIIQLLRNSRPNYSILFLSFFSIYRLNTKYQRRMSTTPKSCTSSAHLNVTLWEIEAISGSFLSCAYTCTHRHSTGPRPVSTSKKQMVVIKMKHADNRFTFSVDLMGKIKSWGWNRLLNRYKALILIGLYYRENSVKAAKVVSSLLFPAILLSPFQTRYDSCQRNKSI